jgi:two-component system, cell cycle sensor histidine kinase and response regulator CckA
VEDEAGVRELAHRVLSRYGYKAVAAESGVQALRLWQEHARRFDLLLTDMVMPDGLSGRDLATRLREESPQLKVVYTSGYSVDVNGGEMLLHEGINFLPKPYPARQLAAVVRNCLDV